MKTPPLQINRKWHLAISVLLLIVVVLVQEYSGLDMGLQQLFYGADGWLLDNSEPVLRFAIYDFPKTVLVLYCAAVLLLLVLGIWVQRLARFRTRRNVFVVLCLLLVPAFMSVGKKEIHVHCPYQYQEFGGTIPYVTLLQTNKTEHNGRCFPAGHASGGFALLLFVMIATTRRRQMLALAGAMALGWSMGGYQMLNGRHFVSHTLATMLIAWIIVLIVHILLFGNRGDSAAGNTA